MHARTEMKDAIKTVPEKASVASFMKSRSWSFFIGKVCVQPMPLF